MGTVNEKFRWRWEHGECHACHEGVELSIYPMGRQWWFDAEWQGQRQIARVACQSIREAQAMASVFALGFLAGVRQVVVTEDADDHEIARMVGEGCPNG